MDLKIKRINHLAQLPVYAHEGDAGLDLFSVDQKTIKPGESCLVRTGLIIELPKGTEAQIRPRSGLALKHQITLLNSPGTIDSGYRGEIGVVVINHGHSSFSVDLGMKIAQMVVQPVLKVKIIEVNELSASSRGGGGFGSTGE